MSQRAFPHRAGEPHGSAYHAHHDWVAEHSAHRHPDDGYAYDHDDETPAAAPARPRRTVGDFVRGARRQDYTLGHGAWQVRIGPVAFWICVGTLVIMAGWAGVTATYFAFHDDVLARLIARQAAMQFAYEDRIAEMRAQVDRVTSRQLLDQDQFERRLDQLAKRQAALEARTSSLGVLTDPAITGAIKPNTRGIAPRDGAGQPKPAPISGSMLLPAPAERDAALSSPAGPPVAFTEGGAAAVLARLQDSLDRVEANQTASLNSLEQAYDGKLKRMRGVLADLGLNAAARSASEPPTGGPFVPYRLASGATPFERQVHRIAIARAQADKLARTMSTVPLRQPVNGELDPSSGFGVRIDPFLNRPAMHTGIDFRGNIGDAVRATASGTVTAAGWSGGYGRMVEIEHGNGLSTRYGHLSEIEVKVGQTVKIGQVVGRLGSTGRSTGPHLHYETRIDGEAVDPDKFLRAGVKLGAIQ
jgi:murein DD-endopeptidase MepM/ murein hydrolase activator NlpD